MLAFKAKNAPREFLPRRHRRAGRSSFANTDRIRAKWSSPGNLASAQLVYIGNNPLSGIDPTGYIGCGEVSSDQASTSGSCDFTGKDGKTTSIGYAFNSKGDVGIGSASNMSAISGAVSIGVLQSNGAVGMSSAGAGGMKNAQADASSQMSLGNTPNTPSGQSSPTGSITGVSPSTHDNLQGAASANFQAGFGMAGAALDFIDSTMSMAGGVAGDVRGFFNGNFTNPYTGDWMGHDERLQAVGMAGLMLLPGGAAERGLGEEFASTTAFRVEGAANQRIAIDAAGNVSIHGDGMLFLNFGQQARADSFLARRMDQFGGVSAILCKRVMV